MTGAYIILAVTIAIGVLLWAWERFRIRRHGHSLHHHVPEGEESRVKSEESAEIRPTQDAICCGLHSICEKTGQVNEPPVYYDDEELDRFAGRRASEYSDDETEEFRDVLLTLLPEDVPGWAVSLEKRRISVPAMLLPEFELMLSEARG